MDNKIKNNERIKITTKTKAMKAIENKYKNINLSFDFKTVYFKSYDHWNEIYHNGNEHWFWSKTNYEVSFYRNDKKESLTFEVKRGYKTLDYYFYKALKTLQG